MKEILGVLVQWLRLDDLVRVVCASRRVTIIVYHDPSPEALRRHLGYFAKRYTFITMDAFAQALISKRWQDLPRYPMVLTVDDGHVGNIRVLDVLAEFGVRPMIYLCSGIVGTERAFWWKTAAAAALGREALKCLPDAERRELLRQAGGDLDLPQGPRQALDWSEIEALSSVADFGAHTRSHPILPRCTDPHCTEEIALCKTELEAALGRACSHFAYPNGDYGEREVAEVRRAGYVTGRTIDIGWNGPNTDPYRLRVIPVRDDASTPWLAAQMTALPSWLRHLKLKIGGRLRARSKPGTSGGVGEKAPA